MLSRVPYQAPQETVPPDSNTQNSRLPNSGAGPQHFVFARGYLLPRGQGLAKLAWLLWLRGDALGLRDRLASKRLHPVPGGLLKILRIGRLIATFAVQLIRPPAARETLPFSACLPTYGQLGLALRAGGYKFFDLERCRVLTVLPGEREGEKAREQIARAQQAARLGLGPAVLKADLERGCYEEELVLGRHPAYVHLDPSVLCRVFAPFFARLARRAQAREPVPYLLEVQRELRALLSRPAVRTHSALAARIDAFVTDCLSAAEAAREPIYLGLSHGDAHEHNLLLSANGTVAVDWVNLRVRSATFDLYTLLFRSFLPVRPFWTQAAPLSSPDLSGALFDDFLDCFTRELEPHQPRLAAQLSARGARRVYRHIFYAEFLVKSLEKLEAHDAARRRLAYCADWSDVFARFERRASGETGRTQH